ncbi:MAG: hypothetical protein ACRDDZ_11490 [Marinifilaceae bacterium]
MIAHFELAIINAISLVGDIANLNNKKQLEFLQMFNNKLTGELQIAEMFSDKLTHINLSGSKITGTLEGIGSLTNLRALYLDKNSISGAIPSSIGQCRQLSSIWMDSNNLTGNIPSEIYNTQVQIGGSLRLSNNRLSGELDERLLTDESVLGGLRWEKLGANIHICPQQSGYGFSNCNN